MMFTETYIKMAKMAGPIQAIRPVGEYWQKGDCYFIRKSIIPHISSYCYTHIRNSEEIFVPNQSQLQEFSGLSWFDFLGYCIVDYITSQSSEEAGIQVVMRLRHNLQWTGEGWEEIK